MNTIKELITIGEYVILTILENNKTTVINCVVKDKRFVKYTQLYIWEFFDPIKKEEFEIDELLCDKISVVRDIQFYREQKLKELLDE